MKKSRVMSQAEAKCRDLSTLSELRKLQHRMMGKKKKYIKSYFDSQNYKKFASEAK